MKRIAFSFCALALIAMIGTTANATTFMSDSFSYAAGQLTDTNAGANVSGGLWQTHSGATSGKVQVTATGEAVSVQDAFPITGEDVSRLAFNSTGLHTIGAGETWYYAALVTINDTRAGSGAKLENQSYILHFRDSGTFNFRTRAHVTDPSTGIGGAGFRFGLSGSSGNPLDFSADLNFGQQYKVVGSYEVNTGQTNLWVDPVSIASPSLSDLVPGAAFTLINNLSIRQDTISSGPTFNAVIDSVALGDDFDSVVANAMNGSNIPEPASLALVLLGLAGIASTRRRS